MTLLLVFRLFPVFCPFWEFSTQSHRERHYCRWMAANLNLRAHCHWAVRFLQHVKPTVTWDIWGFEKEHRKSFEQTGYSSKKMICTELSEISQVVQEKAFNKKKYHNFSLISTWTKLSLNFLFIPVTVIKIGSVFLKKIMKMWRRQRKHLQWLWLTMKTFWFEKAQLRQIKSS